MIVCPRNECQKCTMDEKKRKEDFEKLRIIAQQLGNNTIDFFESMKKHSRDYGCDLYTVNGWCTCKQAICPKYMAQKQR